MKQLITPYLVWVLPSLEILIAGCLLFNQTRLAGLMASVVLLFLFNIFFHKKIKTGQSRAYP